MSAEREMNWALGPGRRRRRRQRRWLEKRPHLGPERREGVGSPRAFPARRVPGGVLPLKPAQDCEAGRTLGGRPGHRVSRVLLLQEQRAGRGPAGRRALGFPVPHRGCPATSARATPSPGRFLPQPRRVAGCRAAAAPGAVPSRTLRTWPRSGEARLGGPPGRLESLPPPCPSRTHQMPLDLRGKGTELVSGWRPRTQGPAAGRPPSSDSPSPPLPAPRAPGLLFPTRPPLPAPPTCPQSRARTPSPGGPAPRLRWAGSYAARKAQLRFLAAPLGSGVTRSLLLGFSISPRAAPMACNPRAPFPRFCLGPAPPRACVACLLNMISGQSACL